MKLLRRTSSSPLVLCLAVVVSAALITPALAGPRKGATYAGKVHQFNGYKLPIRFTVSSNGKSVGGFKMADGPPTANSCASGPWGHPVSRFTRVGESGRFEITMTLRDEADNPNVGQVTVEGRFRAHGKFTGTVHTRTDSKSCNDDFPFEADAG